VVDVGGVFDRIVGMLHCRQSQFYEWLPYNQGRLDHVPQKDEDRRVWLATAVRGRLEELANRYRDLVVAAYRPRRGNAVRTIEAFEACEYGAPLDDAAPHLLFPF
jgi:hypothetical protein